MRAVVVDDSRLVRERVLEMLSELTFIEHIAQAVDGPDGLAVIAAVKPDLVVLDIQMPRADGTRVDSGIDVLRVIKLQADPPVVIMLSNFAEPQYRARCAQFGADAFLDKSNEFSKLIELAETLLKQRRSFM